MKICQIYNNKAWWIFEADTMPEFHPSIVLIDITNLNPQPQEGWDYNAAIDTFTAPVVPAPTLAEAQTAAIDKIMTLYNQTISAGFITNATGTAVTFKYDQPSQIDYLKMDASITKGISTFPVSIPDINQNPIQFTTQTEYEQFVKDMATFDLNKQTQLDTLCNQVRTCTTVDEVNAIQISFS